jgi:RecQ-mediated genome instability protein 1
MQALIDDGQDATLHAVVGFLNGTNADDQREQYLFSDLAQSTTPSAYAIPSNAHKIRLFSRPTLLQILSITEIGSSAFQLQTVAEQRKDIINGTTLIRRMDDELDDEEEEAIKEGKMPVYPRGMLKFELTLGDGRVVDAIEYKKVPGIVLGETSLGAKLKMKNVKVLRGIRQYSHHPLYRD